jgi:hypothetical protein
MVPGMDGTVRVDRADAGEHTLALSAAGRHVLLFRLRDPAGVEEVVDGAGAVAVGAVNAWTLIGHDLTVELNRPAATALGLSRDLRLRLDLDADGIRRVRTALLTILECACFVVDTPDGRVTG